MKKLILVLSAFLFLTCSDESTILSGIRDGDKLEEGDAVEFMLEQNYPNPFNPATIIGFTIFREMRVCIKVYTDDWQEVKILIDEKRKQGRYVTHFDGLNSKNEPLPNGEYFYTIEKNGTVLIRRMKILR